MWCAIGTSLFLYDKFKKVDFIITLDFFESTDSLTILKEEISGSS